MTDHAAYERFSKYDHLLHSGSFERRRQGSREIGNDVVLGLQRGDTKGLEDAIRHLIRHSVERVGSANLRKGGLIGLAGCVVALGDAGRVSALTESILRLLLKPVIYCFRHDPEVRVYSAEALYNILRVVRGKAFFYFTELFQGLLEMHEVSELAKMGIQVGAGSSAGGVGLGGSSSGGASVDASTLASVVGHLDQLLRQLVVGELLAGTGGNTGAGGSGTEGGGGNAGISSSSASAYRAGEAAQLFLKVSNLVVAALEASDTMIGGGGGGGVPGAGGGASGAGGSVSVPVGGGISSGGAGGGVELLEVKIAWASLLLSTADEWCWRMEGMFGTGTSMGNNSRSSFLEDAGRSSGVSAISPLNPSNERGWGSRGSGVPHSPSIDVARSCFSLIFPILPHVPYLDTADACVEFFYRELLYNAVFCDDETVSKLTNVLLVGLGNLKFHGSGNVSRTGSGGLKRTLSGGVVSSSAASAGSEGETPRNASGTGTGGGNRDRSKIRIEWDRSRVAAWNILWKILQLTAAQGRVAEGVYAGQYAVQAMQASSQFLGQSPGQSSVHVAGVYSYGLHITGATAALDELRWGIPELVDCILTLLEVFPNYREHYLEMQVFLLVRVWRSVPEDTRTDAQGVSGDIVSGDGEMSGGYRDRESDRENGHDAFMSVGSLDSDRGSEKSGSAGEKYFDERPVHARSVSREQQERFAQQHDTPSQFDAIARAPSKDDPNLDPVIDSVLLRSLLDRIEFVCNEYWGGLGGDGGERDGIILGGGSGRGVGLSEEQLSVILDWFEAVFRKYQNVAWVGKRGRRKVNRNGGNGNLIGADEDETIHPTQLLRSQVMVDSLFGLLPIAVAVSKSSADNNVNNANNSNSKNTSESHHVARVIGLLGYFVRSKNVDEALARYVVDRILDETERQICTAWGVEGGSGSVGIGGMATSSMEGSLRRDSSGGSGAFSNPEFLTQERARAKENQTGNKSNQKNYSSSDDGRFLYWSLLIANCRSNSRSGSGGALGGSVCAVRLHRRFLEYVGADREFGDSNRSLEVTPHPHHQLLINFVGWILLSAPELEGFRRSLVDACWRDEVVREKSGTTGSEEFMDVEGDEAEDDANGGLFSREPKRSHKEDLLDLIKKLQICFLPSPCIAMGFSILRHDYVFTEKLLDRYIILFNGTALSAVEAERLFPVTTSVDGFNKNNSKTPSENPKTTLDSKSSSKFGTIGGLSVGSIRTISRESTVEKVKDTSLPSSSLAAKLSLPDDFTLRLGNDPIFSRVGDVYLQQQVHKLIYLLEEQSFLPTHVRMVDVGCDGNSENSRHQSAVQIFFKLAALLPVSGSAAYSVLEKVLASESPIGMARLLGSVVGGNGGSGADGSGGSGDGIGRTDSKSGDNRTGGGVGGGASGVGGRTSGSGLSVGPIGIGAGLQRTSSPDRIMSPGSLKLRSMLEKSREGRGEEKDGNRVSGGSGKDFESDLSETLLIRKNKNDTS